MSEKRVWDTSRERERKQAYRQRRALDADFEAGLRGEEPPFGRERFARSGGERERVTAWASGVWRRQADAEERRRLRVRLANGLADDSRERQTRAEVYARWRLNGVRSGEVAWL
jgi:hypothetical protein